MKNMNGIGTVFGGLVEMNVYFWGKDAINDNASVLPSRLIALFLSVSNSHHSYRISESPFPN